MNPKKPVLTTRCIMTAINRNVPRNTAITIIFGRTLTTSGWVTFAILMAFAWGLGGNSDTAFLHFTGELKQTTGVIIEVDETNMEINEQSVWMYVYEYRDDAGYQYIREAYSTGRSLRNKQNVTVEYPVDAPHYGRIPGVRSAVFNSWLLISYIFPFIGLAMVYFGIKRGLTDYKLLKIGQLAQAKLIQKKATNTSINEQKVYELTFQFQASDNKKYQKIIKSHQTEHLEDDDFERIFYNPNNPAISSLVDDLPGTPDVTDDGSLRNLNDKFPLKPVLWPIISITPHILYFISL